MSEVPLYTVPPICDRELEDTTERLQVAPPYHPTVGLCLGSCSCPGGVTQGYLAHKKHPPPKATIGPRTPPSASRLQLTLQGYHAHKKQPPP